MTVCLDQLHEFKPKGFNLFGQQCIPAQPVGKSRALNTLIYEQIQPPFLMTQTFWCHRELGHGVGSSLSPQK